MSDLITALYIVAFSLFIIGLHMLRGPRTAVRGNQVAAVGMAIAVVATLLNDNVGDWALIVVGLAIGTAVGVPAARNVKMTAMPQMVALFNGVGGGAVALISVVEYREALEETGVNPELEALIPILVAAIIGSISFWGSIIAFLKLQETLKRGFKIPKAVNGVLALTAVGLAIVIASGVESELLFWLILLAAGALGVLAVLPIGGADMPVVISSLNAFTGLSAAAAGLALDNTALIVAGMLVGASGSILTKLMADAMNRSIANIFFGGLGAGGAVTPAHEGGGTVRSTSAADVAIQLSYARLVVVVPGYGMAVAQAQRAVADLAAELERRGVEVLYGIHPVAGRMPGHMNVLLAEADVPYDKLKEMDDINPEFPRTDVALVIGANDVTNPAARTVTDSPIYGMPILDVDKAGSVIVLKRSMSSGFAGIDNPLFYNEKTSMLFGDAKASVGEVLAEVQAL
jgi:proton-translocating NAD(P)+ transhydrogenase subunit beta